MSATSSTAEPHARADTGAMALVAATMKHWWLAYINWRIEHAAIATLGSMSDHDLIDIGLGRSDITGAVKTPTAFNRCSAARDT